MVFLISAFSSINKLTAPVMYSLPSVLNGHFSRWTWVILDFIGAKDDRGGGDDWSYKTCKVSVKSLPTTNQHPTFYRLDGFPVAQSTASKL